MSIFNIKSHAKINLALNIIGKSKRLHKIESIVAFLDLYDEIEIKKVDYKDHKIKFLGKFSSGIKSKNTVSQLFENIEKKKLLKNKYQVIVKKNIPTKAGLGGGSMNAANILNFFVKKKLIKVKKKEIIDLSNSIGSDVILGLYSKSLVLNKKNQIKLIPFKNYFYTLIVKPNFGCSTKLIYSKVKKFNKPKFDSIYKNYLNLKFLKFSKNDLEVLALNRYPKLKDLKTFLEKLPNIKFVRMTGSGSACYGLFVNKNSSLVALKKLRKKYPKFWFSIAKTI